MKNLLNDGSLALGMELQKKPHISQMLRQANGQAREKCSEFYLHSDEQWEVAQRMFNL